MSTKRTNQKQDDGGAKRRREGSSNHQSTRETPDPFRCSLRCQNLPENAQLHVWWWHTPSPPVPLSAEEALLPVILRWKKKERGMMFRQPAFRLDQIRKKCRQENVPLLTALSLRRHHMKRLNRNQSMGALQLGTYEQIRQAAALFEDAIAAALRNAQVSYWSEEQQKEHIRQHKQPDEPFPPTPDFILKKPVLLKTFTQQGGGGRKKGKRKALEERRVHWIEVKMFYGASTIEHDGKSAVGTVLGTARKYVRVHGSGAMIFLYGVGERLAAELAAEGVTAMDGSGGNDDSLCRHNGVDLSDLLAQQRTWCADKNGNILI